MTSDLTKGGRLCAAISQRLRKLDEAIYFTCRIRPLFTEKSGIEIGGPTPLFIDRLPIYSAVKAMDGCNFGTKTVWEGCIEEGKPYTVGGKVLGTQYIGEANNLQFAASNHYDFLIASHCLEHCANPIKTLLEWKRVVRRGGVLLLILPDKRFTFDHRRKAAKLQHLMEDYAHGVDEDDLTHLQEILELHDLTRDPAAGTLEQFRERSLKNLQNRCLHHHVFDFELLEALFEHVGIHQVSSKWLSPYHQIVVGRVTKIETTSI